MSDKQTEGIVLENIDEKIHLNSGPVFVVSNGKQIALTRATAIVQALETYSSAEVGEKFKAFDVGIRFMKANGSISINLDESALIKLALEKAWPQPGVYVPLCRWLEGK